MFEPPYDQLYIYEVNGDARGDSASLGPGFLGLWLEGTTSFLFFSEPSDAIVQRMISRGQGLEFLDAHHLTYEQWQGGLSLEPLVLDGLTVIPAWAGQACGDSSQPVIRLDPGLVFGNGLHPTTRHCLEYLIQRSRMGPLGRVIDLGCGTGILALAASALGAEHVAAVDLNPLCVETTRNNARINGAAIETAEAPALDYMGRPSEVVLANLPWQVMKDLLEEPEWFAHGPDLLLSGITRSHVGSLEDALGRIGYQIRARREAEQTWFSLWAVGGKEP